MKDQERTPLRVVLQNFLNHIENLESQNCPEKSYEAEFQDLKLFSENVKCLKEYSCFEGEKEINRKKNRYKDILPFDLSRVVLNEYAGIPGSDYINANFIKGASGSPAYIASQGPLPSTVNDFWRMVVQCEVQVIVMACNEEEAGKAKCEKYWVDEGEEKQFGMITVKLLKSSTVCSDFSVRTMRLKYNNSHSTMEERTVCQLHYVAWPDHGVPTVVQPLLDMVRLVRDTQASETLPVLVHCSAGCGRTGTICAIDYVWGLLRTGKLTNNFSLLSLIREMRKQRIAMVQTKEQYVLVHQAVRELFKEQLCMIDSHPYENVDTNGLLIIKEEEHVYDSIESLSNVILEEKQDYKQEKDVPPPLPKKKQQTFFSSKKEKDVENLSAQQRAIHRMPKINKSSRHGETQIKRNEKLNSLHENYKESNIKRMTNPIPSKGILRVPQIDTSGIKTVGTIKRSKSLKVVSNDEKQKLIVCSDLPMESKRRASLESNLEESINSFSLNETPKKHGIDELFHEQYNSIFGNSVPKSIKKYEELNIIDQRRPLVRSYTTLDMRTKISQEGNNIVPRHPNPSKIKLSRSNTQVDFSKILSTKNHSKSSDINDSDFKNINSFNPPLSKVKDTTELKNKSSIKAEQYKNHIDLLERSNDRCFYDSKMVPFSPHKDIKDLRKVKPKTKKMSTYQPLLPKEHVHANQPSRIQNIMPPPHLDINDSFKLNKSTSDNTKKPYCYDSNGSVVISHESLYSLDSSSRNPANCSLSAYALEQKEISKSHRMGKISSPETQYNKKFSGGSNQEQAARGFMDGKSLRNQKNNIKQDYQHLKTADKTDIRLSETPKTTPGRLMNISIGSAYLVKESLASHITPQKRLDMELGLGHQDLGIYNRCMKTSTPFTYGQVKKRTNLNPNLEDCINRIPNKQVVHDGHFIDSHYQGNVIPKSNLSDSSNHRLSSEIKQSYEPSPSTSTKPWHISNESQVFDKDAKWNFVQETKIPKSFSNASGGFPRNPSLPSKSDDANQANHGMKDNNYFLSAPGVDIDKVAASIPQKDSSKSNFMKVALEAFSLRQSKQQWKREDNSPKASVKPEAFNRVKKKQQQYL